MTTQSYPDLTAERRLWALGYSRIAGIDEAGRGPWAGPVVAAAVILPPREDVLQALAGVTDSKRLSPAQREALFHRIHRVALGVGVGEASAREIDAMGIVPATQLAMHRAIVALPEPPDYLLIDYVSLPDVTLPQEAIVKGDARVLSIAAASIIAKVTRDRIMVEMDARYPGYGFARHKGYGTRAHREALRRLGPSPIHRTSWNVNTRQDVGQLGEEVAARALQEQGYVLLGRNVRIRGLGEIDILAREGDTLVVVEVRTRKGGRAHAPEDSVGPRKQAKLAALAQAIALEQEWEGPLRVDLVAVELTRDGRLRRLHVLKDIVQ